MENSIHTVYSYTSNHVFYYIIMMLQIDHLRESGLIDAEAPNPRVKPEGSRVVQPSEVRFTPSIYCTP